MRNSQTEHFKLCQGEQQDGCIQQNHLDTAIVHNRYNEPIRKDYHLELAVRQLPDGVVR